MVTIENQPEKVVAAPKPMGAASNFFLLLTGLAIGQGSVFLGTSWLVHQGDYQRLADFGSAFNFATLFILLVDAGCLTSLSKQTARLVAERRLGIALNEYYSAATIIRLTIALAAVISILLYAAHTSNVFSSYYAFAATPALFIWSFNLSGILDGLRRSGLSGISSSAMFLLSALLIVVTQGLPDDTAGTLLGAAFTVGSLFGLCGQYVALRRSSIRIGLTMPSLVVVNEAGRAAVGLLSYTIPGQILFRVQIVICSLVLGSTETGIYIYARQTVSAILQVISFSRRHDFPPLISRFERSGPFGSWAALRLQRTSLFLSLSVVLCVFVAVVLGRQFVGPELASALAAIGILLPLAILASVNAALSFGLLAMGRFRETVFPVLAAVAIGVPACFVGATYGGLVGISISEFVSQIVSLIWLFAIYHKIESSAAQGGSGKNY